LNPSMAPEDGAAEAAADEAALAADEAPLAAEDAAPARVEARPLALALARLAEAPWGVSVGFIGGAEGDV
jgi:hypothetical protein